MHAWSKFGLILALALALSACGPLRQISPAPDETLQQVPANLSGTATVTPPVPTPTIANLDMLDAENGWAWTNSNRLLRTSDGGQTWLDRTPGGQIWSEGFFALDAQTAWLPVNLQENNRFGLLHTSDGGQTWAEYPDGPAGGLHFQDGLNGWAQTGDVGAGNIYYSLSETQDGGKTWAPVPVTPPQPESGLPPGTVHLCSLCADSFYYDPDRMIVVHGDMGSMQPGGAVRMQASFDLGKTWQTKNLPLPKNSADALVSAYRPVFFGDRNGWLPVILLKMNNEGATIYQRLALYVTQDGGANWSLAPGQLENIAPFTQVQIVSPGAIFVLCGNALCASLDGAQTWQTLASNLDFTQSDSRSVSAIDFVDTSTGWALIQENQASALYKTADGGITWNRLTPMLAASAPVQLTIDTSIPTPTLIPTPTTEPTATPQVAFDPNANAERIRFAPNGTWVELSDKIAANATKRYVLSAMQGQVMSVSIPQGPAFSVNVTGADNKPLSDPGYALPFWRGSLPSTQDYIVSIQSQVNSPFTLRIAIDPPGQATQDFGFTDPQFLVALTYTDEFAPTDVQIPVNIKGTPLLTLAFINPAFYSPRTNLIEAYLQAAATADPAIVSTCTQPSNQIAETVTGVVNIHNFAFTRSEFSGAAAGNRYDQIAYRTVWNNKCFEMVFLIHSANIGNYPPGTVVEFDRAALMSKFETVLNTFLAK